MVALRFFSCILCVSWLMAQTASAPAPDGAQQDKILEAMHSYAAQYVSGLPNFLCVIINQQWEAGRNSNRWHKGDQLTSKLTFTEGQEQRSLQSVNGKAVKPGRKHWRTPLVTEGEFGILLSRVLGPNSEASFTWNRWDVVSGKRTAVFDYVVDKQHSTLSLSLSDLFRATLPYHGEIWANAATGKVWRITEVADDIPPALKTEALATAIDYDEEVVGAVTYLLPVKATVTSILDHGKIRNEMQFQDYRKFGAESAIQFGAEPGNN
jgi:hypothetical protein